MRESKLLLKDILEAISAIERFVEGISFEDFMNNDEKSSAVIRKFEIIGEATKGLPEDLKDKHPEIPWKEMAGFRDKLIHFYFGVKYELVWQAIKKRLPRIKSLIQKILEDQ
ncbi:MAG TPA: DUF86 domain-containing protein [Nitrospirae bacterium]|nr:DUF86 domain-containing protein [Nitrospirota bacterium]